MARTNRYALSVKQPWATLLVRGLKRIEVRGWATTVRGRILIHAAKVPDFRTEAWGQLPSEYLDEARMGGGIVGSAVLMECVSFASVAAFKHAQAKHLNLPGWFRPPVLYGFVFAHPRPVPFRPCRGQTRFFRVGDVAS